MFVRAPLQENRFHARFEEFVIELRRLLVLARGGCVNGIYAAAETHWLASFLKARTRRAIVIVIIREHFDGQVVLAKIRGTGNLLGLALAVKPKV